jgi:hypothetical protein
METVISLAVKKSSKPPKSTSSETASQMAEGKHDLNAIHKEGVDERNVRYDRIVKIGSSHVYLSNLC